ncbi:major capsid protein [Sinorhizobium americanum]|uniref:Major capsid protein E n=1 Tax=Sinorhizobium americanum TaxID=194963 RepID=A0A4R2BTY3_9HYPH|nr:major capsid protein [Sinorhizobium americanum]TCN30332.1 major capsid protein E [Sinorhizobium americanum]
MLDIFKDDAFGVVELTGTINKLQFVPGRLGQMGIFTERGVRTTSIAIEEKGGVLALVAPSARGGPGSTLDKVKRKIRSIAVPHYEINDAVMAEEVQGVRAFGSENELETVMGKVAERMGDHTVSFAATQEYARVGAYKGIVTYADGSTLNLFTEFGVSQHAEIDFDLDAASPASGVLRKKCAGAVRDIADALDGVPFSGVHALCGNAFFDDLLAHPEVVESYRGTPMAEVLRQGYVLTNGQKIYGAFEFGGILWENYRGTVGGSAFVHTDKCHLAPIGAPGLFLSYYAPADYMETVNTIGQRLYAKQYDMPNGKGINLDTQMNALELCTRPNALIQGKRT